MRFWDNFLFGCAVYSRFVLAVLVCRGTQRRCGTARHVATFLLGGLVLGGVKWTGTALQEIGKVQGQIKQKWGKLTDDDLTEINGQREQLEGIIQHRYGVAKDLVRKDVDAWLKSQP